MSNTSRSNQAVKRNKNGQIFGVSSSGFSVQLVDLLKIKMSTELRNTANTEL
jgi:hypothetical protein